MTVAVPKDSLSIVATTPTAAETIARLQSEAFEKPWRQNDVRALLTGPTALGFVAYWDKAAAGYIIARNTGEEAELLSLGTSPQYRRLGIGLALLKHLEFALLANRTEKLFLEVDATNNAAIKLYLRENFRKIGTRKLYYKSANGKRSDALVLRKKLDLGEAVGGGSRLSTNHPVHQET